ncbi:MAG TPA: hypothetical protein VMA77_08820 [Solirubrobacteraceae bacterium]|nr:hypothetical protein [Solirubrobacteraceae bacterium]
MTPNIIQAVAQTRIDDFTRAAGRRRLAAGTVAPRVAAITALRSIRRRRVRIAIA